MNTKKWRKEIRDIIENAGCKIIDMRDNSNLVWKLESPTGKPITLVTSNTPSDNRAIKNVRSSLFKLIASSGNF